MNELALFNNLMNGMFDDGADFGGRTFNMPNVDVKEDKDGYKLEMDLPGRTEKDVNLELDHNTLTISSVKEENHEEKNDKHEKDDAKWLIRERRVSEFSRRFTLPDDVNGEKIAASFKNGVLTVTMPRKMLAAPKRISIEVAA